MKGTLHRGSVCPPAGGGREDNRCLKHTQPLRDASGRPPCLFPIGSVPSASVRSSSQPRLPRLPKIQTEVNWAQRHLAAPADLRLSLIPSGEPASRPTRSRSQAKGCVPLSHRTVITGDGLFVVGQERFYENSKYKKQQSMLQYKLRKLEMVPVESCGCWAETTQRHRPWPQVSSPDGQVKCVACIPVWEHESKICWFKRAGSSNTLTSHSGRLVSWNQKT